MVCGRGSDIRFPSCKEISAGTGNLDIRFTSVRLVSFYDPVLVTPIRGKSIGKVVIWTLQPSLWDCRNSRESYGCTESFHFDSGRLRSPGCCLLKVLLSLYMNFKSFPIAA